MKINFSSGLSLKEKCLVKKTANVTLAYLNQTKKVELCVSIVSDNEIKELNERTRGIGKVTDVLSFPALEILAGEKVEQKSELAIGGNTYLGDIVICKDQIIRQAKEYKTTYPQEFVRMVLHSMLHLLGYDHIDPADEKTMHKVEFPIYEKLTKIQLK